MLLLIDNYDSFTYNLVHYLGELGADVRVVRNDKITVQESDWNCVLLATPNQKKPPFDDVRVRRALALTIDRRAVCERITKSGERPSYSIVPRSLAGDKTGWPTRLISRIPPRKNVELLAKSIRGYSAAIGHSLDFRLVFDAV